MMAIPGDKTSPWPRGVNDMENHERSVQQSVALHEGAVALVARCAAMARGLVEAAQGTSALVRGGRKGLRLDVTP